MLPHKFLRLASLPMLFFSVLIFTNSCKKEQSPTPDNTDTSANVLKENVILLEKVAVKTINETSVILINSKLSKMPAVGSILAQSASGSNLGFLRRVTEVFVGGSDQIVCNTETCGLGDAFKVLNLDHAYTESYTSNFNAREGSSLVTSFSHTTFASGLEVNGTLKINVPTVKIEYQKKAGSNAPEKIVMLADINTEESELEITHSDSSQLALTDFPLKQFDLPTIYVKIPLSGEKGAGELVVPFTQKILLYVLPLSINGKVKLHLNPIIHATVGCRYDASANWQNLSIDAVDATNLSQFCSNDFTPGDGVYSGLSIFSPIYEIAPYGSDAMKGSFQFFNYVSLSVTASSPNYSLDYQAGIEGSVNLNFWDGTNRTFDAGADIASKNIASGDWTTCRTGK